MKKYIVLIALSLIVVYFMINPVSHDMNKHDGNAKYIIENKKMFVTEVYYAMSNVMFLNGGCIKFYGYIGDLKDTIIVCGNFTLKKIKK